MNMPLPIPLPLQLSPLQRFSVPPRLSRALLCCAAAFAAALSLWILATGWRTQAETERKAVQAEVQKISTQLSAALETETARATRAKRFARVKAALGNAPAENPKWEQLADQLSTHPHIAELAFEASPAAPAFPAPENMPVINLQHIRLEAGLLHEGALLALDGIATGFTAHLIPAGCALGREADAAPITLRARCEFNRITLAQPTGDAQ